MGVRTGWAAAYDGEAVVSGVVRDSQGVAQMGALVQVLAGNSITVATAFTDRHGHYAVSNLVPGHYQVRASAALFVPATRANLELRDGAKAVVNLTLAALFDTASWLPASRRRADETTDDWQWTLRSTANRPILRITDEDGVLVVASVPEDPRSRLAVRETVTVGNTFGDAGLHDAVSLHKSFANGMESTMRADLAAAVSTGLGTGAFQTVSGLPVAVETGLERETGYGGGSRTEIAYAAHPELVGAGGAGIQVLELRSGQQVALGENLEVEMGGEVDGVRNGSYAVAAHPFIRLTAHPGGSWRLQYRLASSRTTQEFSDVQVERAAVPAMVVDAEGKLSLESGRHQELSVSRSAGNGVVEVAYYHDSIARIAVQGGGDASAIQSAASTSPSSGILPGSVLLDPVSASFRALVDGYSGSGMRLSYTATIAPDLWIAAEYASGAALASEASADVAFNDALGGLKARGGQAIAVTIKGDLKRSGTRLRGSYRWEPGAMVTAIDPYGALSDEAYLSCFVRQRVSFGSWIPSGLDATIDVTNLLAKGYRPFLSADGHTLYFAQTPRTIQAGLSFTF